MDTGIAKDLNLIVVAVVKKDSHMVFNPAPDTVINARDVLIAMGERKNLSALEKKAGVIQ